MALRKNNVKGGNFTSSFFSINFRGGFRTAATSKMEDFVILVNGF